MKWRRAGVETAGRRNTARILSTKSSESNRLRFGYRCQVAMSGAEGEQGRLLSDYKAGEEVEGTVTGVRKRAAFLDVGAVVAGYFPDENWGELAGKIEEGQKLKLRIEKVTGSQLVLTAS